MSLVHRLPNLLHLNSLVMFHYCFGCKCLAALMMGAVSTSEALTYFTRLHVAASQKTVVFN
jgi:hypothetical protein